MGSHLTATTLAVVMSGLIAPCIIAQDYAALREKMVAEEIEAAGVKNPAVLSAMRATPRHEFVLSKWLPQAYLDGALPIGDRQTISPPYVVAFMTAQLDPQPTDRVLEIGTGSGYQAAVLSPLVKEVYTIEIVSDLGRRAERTLRRLDYENVHVRIGDGYQGWPEAAPFDKIIVTCSPEAIPPPLIEQLAEGGRMIIPVGERYQQNLIRVTKQSGELTQEPLQATLFVPMTGTAESQREVLPDPAHPQIANGNFEKVIGQDRTPEGWHYLRGVKVSSVGDAPKSPKSPKGNYLSFENALPGEASRALQGFALDGREVRAVRISALVRGAELGPGPTPHQRPAIILTCYDRRRAVIENQVLGPWQGSFDWKAVQKEIRVPDVTREAILRLGLLGGTGKLDIDQVLLEVIED
ncbi:protein-L-isoaspartate(D-aspartate) O-methyltransferase [Bythopirellula goksoeyrii]|uniref:Protein-L-isoaspartate O-methyltransferase n=1 Tax=Bythopirellula goksoeyrii TaxID=1400387 RepID=A0A5B9QRV4_9BACT|nr:protein-L-isoaspartate(D-aspartate) O-methyltransferase [Bythopirellula goksoeyrii]QEG36713.1 Protein-L-isoaspartate O-methyltransferase [Bythopirellula goksoeyrii]